MSIEAKFQQMDLFIDNELKQVNKELEKAYSQVYKEIKEDLQFYINKGNGALSRAEMFKYNRYNELLTKIEEDLQLLKHFDPTIFDEYIFKNYAESYYYTGYVLETEYQQKLNYSMLNRNKIKTSISNPLAQVSLENNSNVIAGQLKQAITQSIIKGEGINKAGERLKKTLGTNANNVYRIYQTETTRISGKANLDSMIHSKNMGLELQKKWVSTLDGKTRSSHQHLDGQVQDLDKPFSNGLMYPGDPSGNAEDVVNCRCTIITELKGFENAYAYRKARDLTGENKVIPYTNYIDWRKERLKTEYPGIIGAKTITGVTVTDISEHTVQRIAERSVSQKGIIDALENPLHIGKVKVDSDNRKSMRFIGNTSTVNINPDTGNIASVWITGKRELKKYGKS